jgi:hypothetical protein
MLLSQPDSDSKHIEDHFRSAAYPTLWGMCSRHFVGRPFLRVQQWSEQRYFLVQPAL